MLPRIRTALVALVLAAGPLPVAVVIADTGSGGGSSYGSMATGSGLHLIGGSSAFPNFAQGAVNNYYPLAIVQQDGTPSSAALSSLNDIGPLGQTETADTPVQGKAPYAQAKYPSGPAQATVGQGDPQPTATAGATQTKADAQATAVGGTSCNCSGAESDAHTTVNPDGSMTVLVHSHSGKVTLGTDGTIVIADLDVTLEVDITAAGQASVKKPQVTAASVTVGGQPVSIGSSGITVGPQDQPLPGSPPPPGDTFHIFVVQPEITVDGTGCPPGSQCHVKARASGLHVQITQPPTPGAPTQTAELVLADATVDAFAAGGGAAGGANAFGSFGGLPSFGGAPSDGSGAPGAAQGTGAQASGSAAKAPEIVISVAERKALVRMLLLWEALVMAAGSSWLWFRKVSVAS